MEPLLVHLLVGVIVFGVIFAVLHIAATSGWIAPNVARIAQLVVGALFLIWLLVDILLPLIHSGPLLHSELAIHAVAA
jgi:hypothetical protein